MSKPKTLDEWFDYFVEKNIREETPPPISDEELKKRFPNSRIVK